MEALSPWRARSGRWLREPLLHFLLLGGLLFVVYRLVAPTEKSEQRIVVSGAIVEDLARQHRATWMRQPTERELDSLVESHVRDEILYREGLALGLDRDDAVIKRRVRQKLEVMAEEQSARTAPSDAELSAYLTQNAARFTRPPVVSFEQIMFDGSRSVTQVEHAVTGARAALARGEAAETLGQRTLLPHRQDHVPTDLVARDFGKDFAEQVVKLPVGEWAGPVASELGAHLVRITDRSPAAVPTLESVRKHVVREWENEQRERSRTENYRQLRSRYEVVVEPWSTTEVAAQP